MCHEGVVQPQLSLNIVFNDNVQTCPWWKAIQLNAHTAGSAQLGPGCLLACDPNLGKLLELSSLSLFISKMGAIQHVTHKVVSGPSKNSEDVEWLCKRKSSLQCLKAGRTISRHEARHQGGQGFGVPIFI